MEAKVSLNDPDWSLVSATLTVTDVTSSYCVPPLSPYAYFRVSEGPALVPALPIIRFNRRTYQRLSASWTSTTNTQFSVQWRAVRCFPPIGTKIPATITSTNGTFLFLDNGTNSGGLAHPAILSAAASALKVGLNLHDGALSLLPLSLSRISVIVIVIVTSAVPPPPVPRPKTP